MRISIVIPVYNVAPHLARCLESLLAQTLREIEVICVDDGSTDGTLAEIKSAAAKDARVRYVSFSRNFGKEAALFAGLNHASGDLVVTMDADLQHRPELDAPSAGRASLKRVAQQSVDGVAVDLRVDVGEQFLMIFTTVIAFYFGTQTEKKNKEQETVTPSDPLIVDGETNGYYD